ncbi:hypothetical protein DRN69_01345 [Candidatus Pacearchaeota archaeon]|nr:MAG: hypothetical protein DRN69_01345 [Candidatus Pacearchaeota archaeon]
MAIESKEVVSLFISLIGSALLFIWLEYRGYFRKGIEVPDVLIILSIVIIAIIFVIYAKFREINRDFMKHENNLKVFSKRLNDVLEILKRTEDLIDIKSDIKELKRRLK